MDKETADKVINSPAVQKYIDQIDTDAQAALDDMKSNVGGMGDYPNKFIQEYKSDGSALDSAWGDFNAAWNAVVFGTAKDGKAAIAAYTAYVLNLEILEEQNVRFGAYVQANFASLAAAFIKFLIAATKAIRKRFEKLKSDLEALAKLLKKAKREVTEAKAQAALNAGLTAVTLCLGPAGLGARVAVAVGSFTVHMIIDASLGPSKGSALGTLNTAAGEAVGIPEKMKGPWGKLGGAASGILTLGLDVSEIGDAKKIVKQVQDKLKAVQKECTALAKLTKGDAVKIEKLQKAYEKALKAAESGATKFRSGKARREGLLKELRQLK